MKDDTIYTLGKTGDTVIHVFPDGNARINRETQKAKVNPPQHSGIKPSPANPTVRQGSQPLSVNPSSKGKPAQSTPLADRAPDSQSKQSDDFGRSLLQAKVITQAQYEVACHDQAVTGLSLVDALLARGWLAAANKP